jgi:hypothetical protein
MGRGGALLILFATAGRVCAQPDFGPEPEWTEHLVDGKLAGFQIDGDNVPGKDSITIGGKSQATVKLLTPIGERFGLRLEYLFSGASPPALHWQTNQRTIWNLPGAGPTRWMEFSISGTVGGWRRGAHWQQNTRAVDGGFTSSGGLFLGPGALREFTIVVPPNSTLILRRVASFTTPVAERPVYGLASAIVVLVSLLLGVMALGWFLNRRRSASASRAMAQE